MTATRDEILYQFNRLEEDRPVVLTPEQQARNQAILDALLAEEMRVWEETRAIGREHNDRTKKGHRDRYPPFRPVRPDLHACGPVTCKECGETTAQGSRRPRKFCSEACRDAFHNRRKNKKRKRRKSKRST